MRASARSSLRLPLPPPPLPLPLPLCSRRRRPLTLLSTTATAATARAWRRATAPLRCAALRCSTPGNVLYRLTLCCSPAPRVAPRRFARLICSFARARVCLSVGLFVCFVAFNPLPHPHTH